MKLQYIAPEMECICLLPAQRLATETDDATIPYNDMNGPEYVNPESFTFGGTEIEIPI